MWLHHRLTTDDAAEANFSFRFLSSLSELVQAGQIAEALALVEAGLEQSDGS
jgi:hypothetical protein